ncbi:rab escort protein 1 [Lathyrus oleraceus]|uniref:Rab escort protein 1 n=1 Tax=Pisum sativum TaxID=3888 RepID=A0A9D4YFF3_PEA|nr:rab escort protein 1 [Pisum sativum]KAI5438553.1 hypothetical protein KIW84_024332 [Pisum sativum]
MSEAEESSSYPPIDPVSFDLIIVGTGLSESIIAAAASAVGKTILHLDPNSFYGSHFASLSLEEITSYLNSPPKSITAAASSSDSDYAVINLIQQPLLSDAELISCDSVDESTFLLENSRKFNLDLGGPRALFSADKTIDLLLKSGAAQYLEFKGIDTSLVYNANEGLVNVPDSRGAIFRDKKLSLKEKNQLMKFFKLVQQHLGDNEDGKISEEDMESPFVSFLEKTGLPPKIKAILLYAIAMVDFDQENGEVSKDLLTTKDGIDRLAQYSSSVGRFPSAPGALIYPIYGEGELPQAFCRRAAVKGCIYVLRMPVISLLMDKVTESYKGVRLASGQDLYSHQLILDPSFTIPSTQSLSPKGMVARGICITRSSIKPDVSNCSVVYPPRSLYPDQVTSVRALQIGSNLAVCPAGTFVLYFSTLCNDADEGKKLLKASMKALLSLPVSGNTEIILQSDSEDKKAVVLWSVIYVQKLTMSKFEAISSTPTPDGNLNYNDLVDATEKLFNQMYPDEEFFPKTTSPEDSTDDDDDNGIIMEN